MQLNAKIEKVEQPHDKYVEIALVALSKNNVHYGDFEIPLYILPRLLDEDGSTTDGQSWVDREFAITFSGV
jgi:hypothetical protein